MKSMTTFKSITLIALLGAALAAPVLAQGGAGTGAGMGGGMGAGPGTCARMDGANCMRNGGPGARGKGPGARGGRGMQFNQGNTPGWAMMTPEERTAHQVRMRELKTYDECKLVQVEHRSLMETRAKEKGLTLPVPRQNGCDNMKARGLIK